jgi:predicted ATP-grasp superfamily ATP-dependent carboligase
MKSMRVLVTDSDNRSALAATRSLGARGHFVLTAGTSPRSLAAVSRFSSGFAPYPAPSTDPDGFVAAVAAMAREHRIDVVLPMTDITTLLLTQQRDKLPEGCRLPFPSQDIVALAANKAHVMRLAEKLGVPIPSTVYVDDPAQLARLLPGLSYPIVVKPARSRVRTANGFSSTGVTYAHDAAELQRCASAMRPEEFPLLLQERIRGPGVGLFACYENGRAIARFAHRRIREKPPSGGVSVLRESAPLDPDAVEYSDRLLGALGWRGVAMVEFKRDESDGSLKLMEINGRFWGSLQLAIDAGVDFPALAVAMAAGETAPDAGDYRLGVRSRWFWGDVDALLMILLRSRRSLNLPADHPGRWRSLWNFLADRGVSQREEILRGDDPKPWMLETRRWLLGG